MNKLTLFFLLLFFQTGWSQIDDDQFYDMLDSASVYSSAGNYERMFYLFSLLREELRLHPDEEKLYDLNAYEAYAHCRLGYLDKANCLFRKNITLAEQLHDTLRLALAHYGLGYLAQEQLFSSSFNHPDSISLQGFVTAIELLEQIGDRDYLIDAYDAQGYLLFMTGKPREAIHYGSRARDLLSMGWDKSSLPNVLSNLAEYHLALGKTDQAERYLTQAIAWMDTYPGETSEEIQFNVLRNMATVHLLRNRLSEAKKLQDSVLLYATRNKDVYLLRETYRAAIEHAANNGQYKQAFELQSRLQHQLDTLHNIELAIQHDRNQSMLEIGLREKEYQLLQQRLYNQRTILYSAAGISLLLLGLLASLLFIHRQSRRFQSRLQKEVERQTRELRRSNEALERFAYVASHDLRTPLRNVISFLGLIKRRLGDRADADLLSFIQYARDYANHMNRLLNDILQYSKLGGQGKQINRKPISLSEIIHQTVPSLGELIQRKGAYVETGLLPTIKADKSSMERLFQNLIENGLTYNESPAPRVSIRVFEHDDTHLTIAVSDNGIGIEEPYQEKVFEMFTRLHNLEQYPGTGLGLSICRRIVEDLDGRIWLKSQPGRGTTFFIRFPTSIVDAAEDGFLSTPLTAVA